jgi:hypothetical protein
LCVSEEREEEGRGEGGRVGGRGVRKFEYTISKLKKTYLTASDETLPNLRLLPYLCICMHRMHDHTIPPDRLEVNSPAY